LRGYRSLEALRKGPRVEVENGIRVYSAKLPQYQRTREGVAINAAFIEPSPKEKGIYWLVVDERLAEHERLAVISHEIAHLAGGHHKDEKGTQKLAIQTLTNLVGGYEQLSSPRVSEVLQRDAKIKFNAEEIRKEELSGALQYLVDSSRYFGVTRQDWYEAGLRPMPKKSGLDGGLGVFFTFLGILLILSNSSNPTGNVIGSSSEIVISILGIISFLLGISLLGFSQLRRGKIIK
jgi:hypothetical protein